MTVIQDDLDWTADLEVKHGNAWRVCGNCGHAFRGLPRRKMCRVCRSAKWRLPHLFRS